MTYYDLVIIGAGPAGIAAAIAASKRGPVKIALIDRLPEPGGMLTQCFHKGFGRAEYGRELTGPEYVSRQLTALAGVDVFTDAFVTEISPDGAVQIASKNGVRMLRPRAVILATGCRERAIGSLPVYGNRPSGVFTAGSIQRMINLSGYSFGGRALVLGSGDVGVIVAHHLTMTGARVIAVIEKEKRISALARNKERYLDPHGIPLICGSTIERLHGERSLEGATVCHVDENGNPDPKRGYRVDCELLVTSVGLIPELELVRKLDLRFSGDALSGEMLPKTEIPWLFVCGNAAKVHALVDSTVAQGASAGELAADYILEGAKT